VAHTLLLLTVVVAAVAMVVAAKAVMVVVVMVMVMMMMISQTDITRKRCLIEEYQEIIGKTQNALSLKLFSPYYKTRKNYELIITKFSDPLMSIIFTSTDFLYIQFFRVNLKIPCPFTWCSKCLFHNFLRKYCLHLQDD
jgi:hypothetical protein